MTDESCFVGLKMKNTLKNEKCEKIESQNASCNSNAQDLNLI